MLTESLQLGLLLLRHTEYYAALYRTSLKGSVCCDKIIVVIGGAFFPSEKRKPHLPEWAG